MCSEFFYYDETDDYHPDTILLQMTPDLDGALFAVVSDENNHVITKKHLIAGMEVSTAEQLKELLKHLAEVLVEECNLTEEEAYKKIRWATYELNGRPA